MTREDSTAIDVFFSYSHQDEELRERLEKHLAVLKREGAIHTWHDRRIGAGREWEGEIDRHLASARVILLLISPDFIASDYCYDRELKLALERHSVGAARVVPIILRPCDWQKAPFGKLQALPKDARPITLWPNEDEAFLDMARGIRRLVEDLNGDRRATPAADDLSQALKTACREKTLLKIQGQDTSHLDTKISSLKRRMREGAQLRQGDLLADRFDLLEQLGHGGFAQVWKAYDETRDQIVAVKVLHPQYAADKTRRDRFFRGARYMAKLDHPGIVKVIEAELEDGGFYFFTMDYVGGGDLRRAVLGGRLPLAERLRIILDVGEALQYAHGEGVIHRDIKPANILLDLEGRPKLTDFDLVRAVDTTGGTRTSSMLGTFLYAAPEAMLDASQATTAADVYGLGMTALFALHGVDLPPDVLWELADFLVALEVEESYRTVLSKAVARKVEQRFSTVSEFCEALRRALEPRPGSTIAQSSKLETVLATLKQTRNRDERAKIFEGLPGQLGDADASLALVEQLKNGLRNGFDLFWLWWIVEEAERRWRVGSRAQEVLDRFYDHIPEPPAEIFRSIDTPHDGRVELWQEIPAGEGWVGAADGEEDFAYERPRHRVEILQPFAMGVVPVTQEQFATFDPEHTSNTKGALHPVDTVIWYEAVSFCRWLATLPGFAGTTPRLPVEEEWEYACRAGAETRYWSGDGEEDLKRVGRYGMDFGEGTHRVGEKPANPWGLYDVHGNVWEWTASPWDEKRYQGREHGLYAVDPAAPAADLAASSRVGRVMRGGGFWNSARRCRSAYRNFRNPRLEFGDQGFRVLLSSVPSRH